MTQWLRKLNKSLTQVLNANNMKKSAKKVMNKKVTKVMSEFSKGKLHSGSKKGPMVTSRKQALAIGISEGKKAAKKKK